MIRKFAENDSFKAMVENGVECLLTQDLKWIKRAEHLSNSWLAVEKDNYLKIIINGYIFVDSSTSYILNESFCYSLIICKTHYLTLS